jgi:predicted phosphodiesterase
MLNIDFYNTVNGLREDSKSWQEVQRLLIKTKAVATTTTIQEIKDRFFRIAAQLMAGEIELEDSNLFNKYVEKVDSFIGRNPTKLKKKSKDDYCTDHEKILVLSDIHVPNYDQEKMAKALEIAKQENCSTLVINGDFLNGDRLSTHAKFKHENFKEEIAEGRALLEKFAELFDRVFMLDDNHVHDRWRRFLGNNISPDLHFLLTHPYDYMCHGLNKVGVYRSGDVMPQGCKGFEDELSHFLFVGDAMFSHGFVSGKDGASVRTVQGWYEKWAPVFELPKARVFLHGHTHKLGVQFDYDSAIIQTGTLANLEGLRYSMEGHLKGSPPVHGCIILEQISGVTQLESIKVIKL